MPGNERDQQPGEAGASGQEQELGPAFLDVRRFPDMETAGRAYGEAQRALRRDADISDISIYRIQTGPGYTAHVIALGDAPGAELAAKLEEALALGEPALVEPEVLAYLIARREQAKQLGPWVERHDRPGRPVWLNEEPQQKQQGQHERRESREHRERPDASRARRRHETQKKGSQPGRGRRGSWKKKRH